MIDRFGQRSMPYGAYKVCTVPWHQRTRWAVYSPIDSAARP